MINQRKNKRQPEENDDNEPYTRQGNISRWNVFLTFLPLSQYDF